MDFSEIHVLTRIDRAGRELISTMACTLGGLVELLSTKGLLVIKYGKDNNYCYCLKSTCHKKSPDQILLSVGLAFFQCQYVK